MWDEKCSECKTKMNIKAEWDDNEGGFIKIYQCPKCKEIEIV